MIYWKQDMFEIFGKKEDGTIALLAETAESYLMHQVLKIVIRDERYKTILVRQDGKRIGEHEVLVKEEYACDRCGSKWCHGDLCQ